MIKTDSTKESIEFNTLLKKYDFQLINETKDFDLLLNKNEKEIDGTPKIVTEISAIIISDSENFNSTHLLDMFHESFVKYGEFLPYFERYYVSDLKTKLHIFGNSILNKENETEPAIIIIDVKNKTSFLLKEFGISLITQNKVDNIVHSLCEQISNLKLNKRFIDIIPEN